MTRDLFPPAERLHRIHAAPARSSGKAGGNSVDIGNVRWRGEGGENQEKRAVARRIAVCWNVCEGWPTDALEAGAFREVDDLTRELVVAVLHAGPVSGDADRIEVAEKLKAAFARRDAQIDMTGGRPADCDQCYPVDGEGDES